MREPASLTQHFLKLTSLIKLKRISHTLLYIKQITNKDHYNTGNYTQYSMITFKGKESEMYIIHVTELLCCIPETTVFSVVMYRCKSWTIRRLNPEELMLLNCDVGEDSGESLGLQRDPTSQSTLNIHWKD